MAGRDPAAPLKRDILAPPPHDCVAVVLPWLPVDSKARCAAVSRAWRALLEDKSR